MSTQPAFIIDPTKLGTVRQALPCAPTLASCPANQEGLLILHYEQHPAHELPEYRVLHHVVPIWGIKSAAKIEAKLAGDRWEGWFGSGAAGVLPAGVDHWAVWDRSIVLTVIFLHPQFLARTALEMGMSDRVELIAKHNAHDPILTQLGLLLKADLEDNHSSGQLYRESIATAFAARLLNHHAVCQIKPQSVQGGLSSSRLKTLLDYIHNGLEQDLKLSDLANLIGLSPHHLCHLFKQSMGVSLHQYVIQQRVERAEKLLKSEMTIAAIAQACGFNSHSHLTRHFKRIVGICPNAARSQDCTK